MSDAPTKTTGLMAEGYRSAAIVLPVFACIHEICRKELERVMGIEPTWPAWKAGTLPLSYTRSDGAREYTSPAERVNSGTIGTIIDFFSGTILGKFNVSCY